MPIMEALKKYDGSDGGLNLQDYLWKAVQPDKDKYTGRALCMNILKVILSMPAKDAKLC